MRVMRKWDEDGLPDAARGQFGEVKPGLAGLCDIE